MLEILEIEDSPSFDEISYQTLVDERMRFDLREIEILERRIVPTGSGETVLPL